MAEPLRGLDDWLAQPYEYPSEAPETSELHCEKCGQMDDDLPNDKVEDLADKTGLYFHDESGSWHHEKCGGEVWMVESTNHGRRSDDHGR